MDKRLLDILCCPTTKTPVRLLTRAELDSLNRAIAVDQVHDATGRAVHAAQAEALVTRDGKTIYRVEDDIPVMLADEAIASSTVDGFNAA